MANRRGLRTIALSALTSSILPVLLSSTTATTIGVIGIIITQNVRQRQIESAAAIPQPHDDNHDNDDNNHEGHNASESVRVQMSHFVNFFKRPKFLPTLFGAKCKNPSPKMQSPRSSRYVQPKTFIPPPPLMNPQSIDNVMNWQRFEYGSSNPVISMSGEVIPTAGVERYDFILPNAPLTEEQRKYCRCLLRVEERGGAYNPYAVCTSSVGAQVYSCSKYYDWPAMGLNVLLAYAHLHKIDVTDVTDRNSALQAIAKWKSSRGESFYE